MVDISNSLKNAFNEWDARIFVLVSLLCQVFLTLLAPRRKRSTSRALTFFIWSSYLLADWVAGFTLSLLCKSQVGSDCYATTSKGNIRDDDRIISTSKHRLSHSYNDNLLAFWAPFLLLHLGGPDNITAFSMEDNSLWPRHLLGLLFQVGTAVYVVLLSLPHNRLLAPTMLMFLAGTIKSFERMYALYRASLDVFRDSFLGWDLDERLTIQDDTGVENWDYKLVLFARKLVGMCKGIIVDQHPDLLPMLFFELKSAVAFKSVEYELGFLYDLLFTKAGVVYTHNGYALRFFCSSSIMAASTLFFLSSKHDFTRLDVSITYVLLAGAISLDILAYIMLFFSKWTIVSLRELQYSPFRLIPRPLIEIISHTIFKVLSTSNEWSGLMMQQNLMSSCLHHHESHFTKAFRITRILSYFRRNLFDFKLGSPWSEAITHELMEFILLHIKKMSASFSQAQDGDRRLKIFTSRGNLPLESMDEVFRHSVGIRFDKSILMWHIATDLCYHTDEGTTAQEHQNLMAFSKRISNYMLYLLLMKQPMIPSVANWHEMLHDTFDHMLQLKMLRFNYEPNSIPTQKGQLKEVCNHFLSVSEVDLYYFQNSVLKEALILAQKTKEMEDHKERWTKVAEVWADMLQYAANNCPGIAHAQSLSRGGELLTFVSIILHHHALGRDAATLDEYRETF